MLYRVIGKFDDKNYVWLLSENEVHCRDKMSETPGSRLQVADGEGMWTCIAEHPIQLRYQYIRSAIKAYLELCHTCADSVWPAYAVVRKVIMESRGSDIRDAIASLMLAKDDEGIGVIKNVFGL